MQLQLASFIVFTENVFLSYFLLKKHHNSEGNYLIRKKFTLVLKTTYKKLYLKYQDHARFPLLCLASENAFVSYFYSKMAIIH